MADRPFRLRHFQGHAAHRCWFRQTRVVERLEQPECLHLGMIERLLCVQHGATGNLRRTKHLHRFVARAALAPSLHPLIDRGSVLAPRKVIRKARVGQPFRLAHELRPALVKRLAGDLAQHPSVRGPVNVDRRRHLPAIAGRHAIGPGHGLLDQHRIGKGQRSAQQRPVDMLATAALCALHEGGHGAEGAVQGRAVIDPVHLRAVGLAGFARHVHGPGHGLRDAVEAYVPGHGPGCAECRAGRDDDVGLDRGEASVVEAHRRQARAGQVGNDHVGGANQPAHDLAALVGHRVDGQRQLVAIQLQEQAAFPARANRRNKTILAALTLFDADDLGAVLGKQGRAVGAGDVAPEVEDADALEQRCLAVVHRAGPGVLSRRVRRSSCARVLHRRPWGTARCKARALQGRRCPSLRARIPSRPQCPAGWPSARAAVLRAVAGDAPPRSDPRAVSLRGYA